MRPLLWAELWFTFTRHRLAWETCTWPVLRCSKATGLNPTAQSHTSSRELRTMGENNVSTSTNTDELRVRRAHQIAPLCLSLSAGLSKGIWAICPWAKHTFVFPKLYGFPRLDRESKLSAKYVVGFTTQDVVRVDRRSLVTSNYRSSVQKWQSRKHPWQQPDKDAVPCVAFSAYVCYYNNSDKLGDNNTLRRLCELLRVWVLWSVCDLQLNNQSSTHLKCS